LEKDVGEARRRKTIAAAIAATVETWILPEEHRRIAEVIAGTYIERGNGNGACSQNTA
jgi:hypothetical protein